ncbi:MAG: DUF2948 family protein [Alphaproteobacteria bacterium]|nr:DUF2948 family protein [Alphaproteobacteria bacterium]
MDRLKLLALDQEDVEVLSAHLQDAVVKTADIRWRPAEQRVVVALNRFDWAAANCAAPEFCRRRAALRFERVTSCKCRDISAVDKDQVLNLLAVVFEATDQPAGVVTLTFSGGGTLRLEVECLEGELADLGPVWVTECCPEHRVEGDKGGQAVEASKQG